MSALLLSYCAEWRSYLRKQFELELARCGERDFDLALLLISKSLSYPTSGDRDLRAWI
jgi:hypothetical protein